LYLLDRRGS